MRLTNYQLQNFITRIKLKAENMPKYRDQIEVLKMKLQEKINNDKRTSLRVSSFLLAGSWKKGTILRPTGDYPIDVDLVLFVEGDESLTNDLKKLHNYVVQYLEEIYPTKDISKDVDAEGNTKSIRIRFSGTKLEMDIVPVVPLKVPKGYVLQPQRGGGGNRYITSIYGQLDFAKTKKDLNPSYTAIVRALKWWRNYKELSPNDGDGGLSSFTIELIVAYLDEKLGVEKNIESGLIRFFQFVSDSPFPIITFKSAINQVTKSSSPIYVADPTNNENNAAKKTDSASWKEIQTESNLAFETLCIAQSRGSEAETISEWKSIFGPNFNIENIEE